MTKCNYIFCINNARGTCRRKNIEISVTGLCIEATLNYYNKEFYKFHKKFLLKELDAIHKMNGNKVEKLLDILKKINQDAGQQFAEALKIIDKEITKRLMEAIETENVREDE